MKSILIYIPSHTDYLIAKENIKIVQNNFKASNYSAYFKLIFSLSINGVELSDDEITDLKAHVDRFCYIPTNLGGDTNILQGYTQALEIQPDYFWIMSANEYIAPKGIENLCHMIGKFPNSDLFIANEENRFHEIKIKNLFKELHGRSSVGLITSTIYKYSSTSKFYPLSHKWNWTGWGQLVVIQSILSSQNYSTLVEFPDKNLYTRSYSDLIKGNSIGENSIRVKYHNSFFSYPIVAAYFLNATKKEFKVFFNQWLKESWYQINFFRFRKNSDFYSHSVDMDPIIIEKVFFNLIKAKSYPAYLMTKFFLALPIYRFRHSPFLNYLYKLYKFRRF
jgi:hypothetical protein